MAHLIAGGANVVALAVTVIAAVDGDSVPVAEPVAVASLRAPVVDPNASGAGRVCHGTCSARIRVIAGA